MVRSDINGYMARFHKLASMASHLTTDGIKDGFFKKKENARHKKRSSNQFKNQGSNDRNKSRSRVLGLNKWYQSLLRDFDLRSITFQTSQSQTEMDPYVTSTPNSIKLPILDTGKFEQWKFRIQQYLQHEHYALWEVIEFGDSYRAPAQDKSVSGEATPSSRSKGRTVAVTMLGIKC
ncbi:hypothetical protein Tco_0628561 [Tanacetum coccineum]|uniref:Uncharacterized protein n=1 Tax=Tanacetum coccineum TaxID=301880 RepID=A0ABQ4WQP8_9ASTR